MIGAAVGMGKKLLDAGRDGIRADKALEQVFTAMGATAHDAFTGAGDAAAAMSKQIGEPATAITDVQTKLATFKGVWDDPVHGAENFNRATMLAFDLEAAGFGDAEGNVTQLGKALNDPIKGMSALAKAGVTFTDAEKDKIKKLQESGDLLGAQEIIYGALENQVGGVAEATTDGGQRMAAQWENLQDTLGRKLVPVFERLTEIGSQVLDWASENSDVIIRFAAGVVGLAAGVLAINAAFKTYQAIAKAVRAVQLLLNFAMAANPIALVVIAVAGLIAIFVALYKNNKAFRDFVDKMWKSIKEWVGKAVKAVGDWLGRAWKWLKRTWDDSEKLRKVIVEVFRKIASWVGDRLRLTGQAIVALWRGFQAARDTIARVAGNIADRFTRLRNAISNAVDRARDRVKSGLDKIVEFFRNLPQRAVNALRNLGSKLKTAITNAIKGIKIELPFGLSFGGDGLGIGAHADGGGGLMGVSASSAVGAAYSSIGRPGDVISGSRPGARTLSGGLSYHARNRALDFWPGTRALAAGIMARFGARTKELITPWPDLGILNGRRHRFSDRVQAQHDGRTNVRHFHWAMAAGGVSPGGWGLVGENGPELARLPVGTRVIPNAASRNMLGGGRMVIEIRSGGSRLDDLLVEVLRKAIRNGGGVQAVLG